MDEQAFAEVSRLGGFSLRVAAQLVLSRAACRLEGHQAVGVWLDLLIEEVFCPAYNSKSATELITRCGR